MPSSTKAKAKSVAKAVKASPAKAKITKPTASKIPAISLVAAKPEIISDRAQARLASAKAVAAYYAGTSLPFKAAADLPRKADLNPALQSKPTERTAALIAAIITYCDVQSDGTFIRGSGRVPGSLLGLTGAQATQTFAAGPESGCVSNMLGGQIAHVSGPNGGKQAAETVLRLTNAAIANLVAFNVTDTNGKRRFSDVLTLARKTLNGKTFTALA